MKTLNFSIGWRMNTKPVEWLAVGLLLALPAVAVADDSKDPPPSMELLEFLGQWEKVGDKWVDPLQFDDKDKGDTGKKRAEDDHHG